MKVYVQALLAGFLYVFATGLHAVDYQVILHPVNLAILSRTFHRLNSA